MNEQHSSDNKDDESNDLLKRLRKGRENYDTHHENIAPSITEKTIASKIVTAIITILILAAAIFYLVRCNADLRLKEEEEKNVISSMVARFNADTNWRKSLEDLDDIYVSDIQSALIKNDNRPVLINVEVVDVINEDNKAIVNFDDIESSDPEIRFMLECDSEQTKTIIDNRDKSPDYAVIASISSVRRPTNEEIRLGTDDSEMFIAKGRCLELVPMNY